ncbi:Odorant-binding protein 50d-1 [Drosophila willistoni]|uniref:GK21475 n=1 Tax=Drosophila willistoni TaxID=7260 RepID=B4MQ76_DROWI|nr:uncharacterized protein LOC124459991 [Drosophila willistoni]EDW74265.1 Odorant-binding protein 50d-1 [Drosophila willistoni]
MAADFDCEHRPEISAIKNCCKIPTLSLTKYNEKCGKYLINGAHITPCSFECVFTASKALNGTSLVVDNIEPILKNVFNNNEQFVDLYMDGFRNCSSQEKEMIKVLKRRHMPVTGKCTPLPAMYSLCSHRYVYINCPEEKWTNSPTCIEAKNYSLNCEFSHSHGPKKG